MKQQKDQQLYRSFGLAMGAVIGLLFGAFFPLVLQKPLPWWPWFVAAVLWLWALAAPCSLRVLYRPWMHFAELIGFINTRIILAILYFLLFTPISAILKLLGKDAMNRSLDPKGDGSYWKLSEERDKHHMDRCY